LPAKYQRTFSAPVSRVMDRDPPRVQPDEPATRIRRFFRVTGARVVYVVDRSGRLYGQISRSDILSITSAKSNALARHLASDPPITAQPGDRVGSVVERMLRMDEWYAPVVEGGVLAGRLGLEHVIESMITEDPDTLRDVEVGSIMTGDVVTAGPDDFVYNIWERMRQHSYAGLPVVDEKGRLVGMITQYDLLSEGARIALEASGGPRRGPRVREVMTTSVEYLYPWDSAWKAARLMLDRGYGRIPVVDKEPTRRLVGIVDREDIVRIMFGGV